MWYFMEIHSINMEILNMLIEIMKIIVVVYYWTWPIWPFVWLVLHRLHF